MNFFDEERLSSVSHPSLSNDIETFLMRSNWEDSTTKDRHPSTLPTQALRLVSRIIKRNMPVFHAILAGSITPCSPDPLEPGKYKSIQFREPQKTLNAQELADTKCKLEEMMSWITFRLSKDEPGHPAGKTSPEYSRKMKTLPGFGCTISINRVYFDILGHPKVKEDPLASTYYSFQVASIIMHELAHAATFAAVSEDMQELTGAGGNGHLGCGSTCSEIGFEMENRIWGGVPGMRSARHGPSVKQAIKHEHTCYSTSDNHTLDSAIVLQDWPNAPKIHSYAEKVDVRREVKPIHNIWRVSFNWLQRLFQDDFWDSLDSGSYNQDALKMPKTLGMPEHACRDWTVNKQAAKLAVKSILPPGYMWTADLTIKPRIQSGDLIESLRNASRVLRALLEQRFALLV